MNSLSLFLKSLNYKNAQFFSSNPLTKSAVSSSIPISFLRHVHSISVKGNRTEKLVLKESVKEKLYQAKILRGKNVSVVSSGVFSAYLLRSKIDAYCSSGSEKNPYNEIQILLKLPKGSINPGTRVLDLSRCDAGDIEEVAERISKNKHSFLRIAWGEHKSSDSEIIRIVHEQIKKNEAEYVERASPYECAEICCAVYKNHADGVSPEQITNELHLPDPRKSFVRPSSLERALPEGWEVLKENERSKMIQDSVDENGYFGMAVINHKTKQILITHRGTEGTSLEDWTTNLVGITSGIKEIQQETAIEFSRKVAKEAHRFGYRVGIVGHSLGGWLAEVTAFDCISRGYKDVYAVTLDSPGSKEILERVYQKQTQDPYQHLNINELDFTNYLSTPNLVNTCNKHVGEVIHIVPEIKSTPLISRIANHVLSWTSMVSTFTYTNLSHSSSGLAACFDAESKQPKKPMKVRQWPEWKQLGKDFHQFFSAVRKMEESYRLFDKNSSFRFMIKEVNAEEEYLVNDKIGFQTDATKPSSMDLRHFSPDIRNWLIWICEGSGEPSKSRIEDLVNLQVVKKEDIERHIGFKLEKNDEGLFVLNTCDNMNAWNFRRDLSVFLAKYPEILKPEGTTRSLPEKYTMTRDVTKEFVELCHQIIDARLYLFNNASQSEVSKHFLKEKEYLDELKEREKLKAHFFLNCHREEVEEQKSQIRLMSRLHAIFGYYKKKEFEKVLHLAPQLLSELEMNATDDISQSLSKTEENRIRASLNSLLAKTKRSAWKTEQDLIESESYYKKAIECEGFENPTLFSNYGSLLNNWGEELERQKNFPKAIELHQRALMLHEKAIRLDPNINIRRDFGRAVFLLAKAKSKRSNVTDVKGFNRAKRILSTDLRVSKTNPILHLLFEGICIEEFSKVAALEHYRKTYERALANHEHIPMSFKRRYAKLLFENGKDLSLAEKLTSEALSGFRNQSISDSTGTYYTPEVHFFIRETEKLERKFEKK